MKELLSQDEFEGVLHQLLRFPAEYAEVKAALTGAGFTISVWMGVLCIEVGGSLLTAREAYAVVMARPGLAARIRDLSLSVWK
jgi:hypothetical protein